jgi:hypothetical protein
MPTLMSGYEIFFVGCRGPLEDERNEMTSWIVSVLARKYNSHKGLPIAKN